MIWKILIIANLLLSVYGIWGVHENTHTLETLLKIIEMIYPIKKTGGKETNDAQSND